MSQLTWTLLYQDRRGFAIWHAFLGNLVAPFLYMIFWRSVEATFQITTLGTTATTALVSFFSIPWNILVTGIAFFLGAGGITALICMLFTTRRSLRLTAILPGSIFYSFAGVFLLASQAWSQNIGLGMVRFALLFMLSILSVLGLVLCIEALHTRILRTGQD